MEVKQKSELHLNLEKLCQPAFESIEDVYQYVLELTREELECWEEDYRYLDFGYDYDYDFGMGDNHVPLFISVFEDRTTFTFDYLSLLHIAEYGDDLDLRFALPIDKEEAENYLHGNYDEADFYGDILETRGFNGDEHTPFSCLKAFQNGEEELYHRSDDAALFILLIRMYVERHGFLYWSDEGKRTIINPPFEGVW